MNLRWLWLDLFYPQLGLTLQQRSRIFASSHAMSTMKNSGERHHSRWFDVAQVLAPSIFAFAPLIGWTILGKPMGWLGMGILVTVSVLSMWIVVAWLGRITWRPRVCAALREQGYDVCTKCGYWLRGLPLETANCPECGTQRESLPDAPHISTRAEHPPTR